MVPHFQSLPQGINFDFNFEDLAELFCEFLRLNYNKSTSECLNATENN